MGHGDVISVSLAPGHGFAKSPVPELRVVASLGIEGDAHFGAKTQHRYDKRFRRDAPNLRQVHLIAVSVYEDLRALGFDVQAGDLGENITTSGPDLTSLPEGTVLRLGDEAQLELTGLRAPCVLLDRFRPGLRAAVTGTGLDGKFFLRGGVMSLVLLSGTIRPGDRISVIPPPTPYRPLKNV
jgi:MOSC domain-containing protein YiiM